MLRVHGRDNQPGLASSLPRLIKFVAMNEPSRGAFVAGAAESVRKQ